MEALPHDPESAPAAERSRLTFPVVGIGASSGGIVALQRFFQHMPSNPGMAFVVVLHLSPKHESALDRILQKETRMPVLQVTGPVPIEVDRIYLIPPSSGLAMDDGYLRLTEPQRVDGRPVTIDLFFRSLAQAHRERAFCIVMSGSGSDGTQGLGRVKELGGLTFAQSPADAESDSMPQSAIATGLVDIVLPVVDLPQKLVELWENARRIELPIVADMPVERAPDQAQPAARDALQAIMALLHDRTGHDFSPYKRTTVLRRIERRMQVNAVSSLPAYLELLENSAHETPTLLQDMLIGVTQFFRDREAFEALERELAVLAQTRTPHQPVRAWVAGCATGEEAYSLTMLLCEQFARQPEPAIVQVFASDIDQRAINRARTGLYPDSILTDVPPSRMRDHFVKEDSGYRISKAVRDKVTFSTHNVLRDPPFTKVDVVSCRNLMIYLDRDAQLQMLRTFHFALKPGGLLLLGNAESAEVSEGLFSVIDKRQRLYRSMKVGRVNHPHLPRTAIAAAAVPHPPLTLVPRPSRPPLEELHRRLHEQFSAPSVLVDAEQNIVHVDERAAHLLRHVGGTPSTKLLTLVLPDLRLALRAAILRAIETGGSVEAPRVTLQRKTGTQQVMMSVRPIHSVDTGVTAQYLLITFDELDTTLALKADREVDVADPLVTALESELQRIQNELTDKTAVSDTANEDLMASNEELQAVNEELRSTTEELETSAEELQSVNEELITANNELRNGLDETAKLNDDLHNLMASADLAILFLDRSLRIKRFTPGATRLFNLIDTDVGRPLLDITHRLDYETLPDDLMQTLHSLQHAEREINGANGHRFIARLVPYRTSDDRIDGVVLNFIDITARFETEQKLNASEKLMNLVARSMLDYAIITTDPQGRVTGWTEGAQRLFGYTADEMIGQTLEVLFTPEDRAEGAHRHEIELARQTGRSDDERWHLRKDGSRFYCSGVMTRLQDHSLQGFAKIARDMTDSKVLESRRKAQLEAEQATRERLEEASTMKDEFLAVMSHELKNPLNLIQLNAELLLRTPEGSALPSIVRAAQTIRRAVASQVQIIDDLLDLSRLTTGKLSLTVGPLDLKAVVERIGNAVQGDADAKGLTLRLHLDDTPSIQADAVRVEQIVWNLINNALKFTPRGGHVDVHTRSDQGMAQLTVRDSGIGMATGVINDVFDMFRQADFGAARGKGGLGVGLALVKRLVELHGGRVSAESQGVGHGSAFSIWLPAHGGTASVKTSETPVRRDLSGMRALLVDDETDSLESFGLLVEMAGATVTMASTAEAALAHVAEQSFDLVVSDIAMPGMDGHTLIARLRAQPSTRDVLTIAVSGRATAADRTRAMRAGFDAHLGKPVDIDQLIAKIHQLREDRGRPVPAAPA